jgi:hypothetical protein
MKRAWNIKQLKERMDGDLAMCHSQFERNMVKAISGKEIRELAEQISATRRLTPGETAIAQEFGFRLLD